MSNFQYTERQKEALKLLINKKRILLYGGGRSGKTFITARAIIIRAVSEKSRHVCFRQCFNHIKTSLWHDTFPKVFEICFPDIKPIYNKSDYFIEFKNGSQIWFAGLDDKDRTDKILGTEYSTLYFNEISQIAYSSIETAITRLSENTTLEKKAYYDCNPPSKRHWSYDLFFNLINPDTKAPLSNPSIYGQIQMNPLDNLNNLPTDYIDTLNDLSGRKKTRFKDGNYQDEAEGALWNEDMIYPYRVSIIPEFKRIVVAIDPATTKKRTSNSTGIVVCAECNKGEFYVLQDSTGAYTPNEWGQKSVQLYHRWNADLIIGESNNGGDMIDAIVRNIDKNISYKSVTATRGKALRAEPIVSLYEKGKVHHVGVFGDLEDQQITWLPESNESPDRVDALVWGLTELSNPNKKQVKFGSVSF